MSYRDSDRDRENKIFFFTARQFKALVILAVIAGPVGFWIATRNIHVPVGYVAVVKDSWTGAMWTVGDGNSEDFVLLGVWSPFMSYDLVYVATDRVDMWGEGDEDLPAADDELVHYSAVQTLSKDGLNIEVDLTVRWRLNPDKVLDLYRLYPAKNWRNTVIIPTIRESCRNILTEFTGMDVISNRSAVDARLNLEMETNFWNLPSISEAVIYDQMNMRNIGLPGQFTAAIEEKATQEQLAVAALYQAQQITTIAQANADAVVIAAAAAANATIVNANAMAQAVLIQADSIAEAVDMLANVTGDTGNATAYAMMYLWIQALQVIADSTGNATFFITFGEGGIPFVYPIEPTV